MGLLNRYQKNRWTVLVLLLLLTILSYGLLIPFLGFYFDDWPVIYMIKTHADFWAFYQFDRPFSAWTYVVTAPILGTNPLHWHIFTLLLRWLTSLGLWWTLKLVWPKHTREATWIALIFSVHPVFLQQSIAVAYSQHFITYALFFLSCGTMLVAFQKKRFSWLFSGISILSAILHIFTMEYFWGLELIRPLLLWMFLSNQDISPSSKLKKTISRWLPYLLVLIIAIVWRIGFYGPQFVSGDDPNSLRLLTILKTTPVEGIQHLIEMVLKDLIFIMVTTWNETLKPNLINIQSNILVLSWLLVAVSIILLWFYRTKLESPDEDNLTRIEQTWIRQAVVLGIAIFLAGTIPVWLTDKQIAVGMYSDRFALPAMWGASVLLVGLLSSIGISNKPRAVILGILIGLSIGAHFRVSNEFRWDWTQQQRFFWQLYLRAPRLEPNTPVFSEGTVFSFVGDYPTTFALNTLYSSEDYATELPYWFIELDSGFHNDPISYLNGLDISQSLRNYSFSGNSLESIVLYYNYGGGNCLWVLDESDLMNSSIPELIREALPLSNLNRIRSQEKALNLPSRAIFGEEPEHQWCYYFQKAELAQKAGDWDEIIQIEKVVEKLGFDPNNKLEWLPFIEAYIQVGQWEKAKEMTLSAYQLSPITRKTFCSLWGSLSDSLLKTPLNPNVIMEVEVSLGCQ
jgi:hypothetical protein